MFVWNKDLFSIQETVCHKRLRQIFTCELADMMYDES